MKIHPTRLTPSRMRRLNSEKYEKYDMSDIINNLEIKKCRCNKYIPSKDNKCGCGRNLNEHENSVIQTYSTEGVKEGEIWNPETCTIEDGQTDAFGDIRFEDNSENISKYIRIHFKTKVETIIKILFDNWNLKEPKLLISVIGGAKRFSLKQRLQGVFRRGLVKAALSTGAWISTGGFNIGVMKYVGEAIREHGSTFNPDQKIVVLGIAGWDMVTNKESLIRGTSPKDDDPVDYVIKINEKEKKKPLDPNHTHFILVDNGKIGFGGEIDFRAALESAISKRDKHEIPIVVLVLEGGVGTLKTVLESVKNGTPCVLVEGSGKCADILAFAFKSLEDEDNQTKDKDNKKKIINEKLKAEIINRIIKEWSDADLKKTYDQLQDIIENYNFLLTVFSLDASEKAYDIDVAILTTLFKVNKDNYINQLKLALTWNRVDIARDFIFTQDISIDTTMNEIMFKAIVDNRVEFVSLLLENGFSLKKFLTYRRLLELYNKEFANKKNRILKNTTQKISSVGSLNSSFKFENKTTANELNENGFDIDFKTISLIFQDLVDHLYEPFKKTSEIHSTAIGEINKLKNNNNNINNCIINVITELKVEYPEQDLFIFSIISARPGMAKVFWTEGINKMILALIASKVFKRLSILNIDEDSTSLKEYSIEFEKLAVMTLNECYKSDDQNSLSLLIRPVKEFNNLTALQVAVSAEAKEFLSHSSTQGILTKLWYNKISPDLSMLLLFISILCPLLAPRLIDFRKEKKNQKDNIEGDELSSIEERPKKISMNETNNIYEFSYFEKLYYFLKAPYVKFIYNQVFYVLFLMLFSYIMLCDFYPVNQARPDTSFNLAISVPEIILIIWVSFYMIDEIRQFSEVDVRKFKARIIVFFSTNWNSIETMCIILFYIGLILRFIPDNYDVYQSARVILCVDLVFWYLKSLSFYTVIRKMGPKLVMINKMLYELMYFIFIVLVFMFAFGVSTQSLMYHNQELNLELFKNVFFPSYFIMSGDYYTRDTIMNAGTCYNNVTDDLKLTYTQDDCPNKTGADVSLALFVCYLVILNILLVNLLIAIFSNTFENVQNESDDIWKFQRYVVIYEYLKKPLLPAPFNLISYIISIIRIILRPIRIKYSNVSKNSDKNIFKRFFNYLSKDWKTGLVLESDEKEENRLIKWEDILAKEYLMEEKQSSLETPEYKIQLALEKIEILNRKFDDLKQERSDVKKKIDIILDLLKNNNSVPEVKQENKIEEEGVKLKRQKRLNKSWEPFHAIVGIITRWKKNENGIPILGRDKMKILEFIVIENSSVWNFPNVLFEDKNDKENILISCLLTQLFNKEIINENIELFKNLLKTEIILEKNHKNSQRNSWIETCIVNYHDENCDLLSNIPFKIDTNDNNIVIWKDLNILRRNENQHHWRFLEKIAHLKNASVYYM